MFANEDFIAASRKFVCIRIETYESKETEKKVRALLNGAFANTAFCIFDPEGEQRLSRAGRGPSMGLSTRRGGRGEQAGGDEGVIRRMNQIASGFKPIGQKEDAVLQDFNSFRQALNVASADQRLLVLIDADKNEQKIVQGKLRKVFADAEVVGKFHLQFINEETDKNWSRAIQGNKKEAAVLIVRAGAFGLDGTVMDQLPVGVSADEIKIAMLAANEKFASLENRKKYSKHVSSGRRQGVYFENEIPYGEDRDGDGEIDNKRRRQRQ
ncbi:MAG: hypothetical protein P8J27_00850 [Mariniblastus sp.]|nr:hypothetical protein [Mariniblastus sp.]